MVTDGSVEPILIKNVVHDKAKQLFENRDVEGLMKLAQIAITTKNNFQNKLVEMYTQQLFEAHAITAKWNKRFMWCYIAGSLLFGFRWVLTALYQWPVKLDQKEHLKPIGIGLPITEEPSHTTGRTDHVSGDSAGQNRHK